MQINPGGRLRPEDVVGRDDEIARYWQVLERQGLVLSAERRIGKTHILLKMREECPETYCPIYQDLEAVHSVSDLLHSIYDAAQQINGRKKRLKAFVAKWSKMLPKIPGIELTPAQDNLLVLIAEAFNDLVSIVDDKKILLLWDEFPLMLHNIQRRHGSDVAIMLLDNLRTLRQNCKHSLRFLFTGSVGLHLVLRSLRKAGYKNDPVNDMMSLTVPAMSNENTKGLATALLQETDVDSSQISQLAEVIADEVGGFPYYVHHVADQLFQLHSPLSTSDVTDAVNKLIFDPHDPANLRYYVNRLSSYYSEEERVSSLLVLDTISGLDNPLNNMELINRCRHSNPNLKDEFLREIFSILSEDHYIERKKFSNEYVYDFRWRVVKRWWKETRL